VTSQLTTPLLVNKIVYGSAGSKNNSNNRFSIDMTTHNIFNNTLKPFEVKLLRLNSLSTEFPSSFLIGLNNWNLNPNTTYVAQVRAVFSFKVTKTSWPPLSDGIYYIDVYANQTTYDYAIEWCYGTCLDICPKECSGHGGCNITTKQCTCDRNFFEWSGLDCSYSQTLNNVGDFLGMSFGVLIVVIILAFLLVCVLPIVLICVCCCGVCVAAGVATSEPRIEYTVINHQNLEQRPLLQQQQPVILSV